MGILDQLRKHQYLVPHQYPHNVNEPIVRVENLTVQYDRFVALDNLNFSLNAGERVAVVGPNGAGKSTLFQVIAGLLRPTRGHVHVFGHEPDGHICIAYVPQRNDVDWNFPVTVSDVVMMGRIGKLGLLRNPRGRDWDVVEGALEVVGMQDLSKRQISQLSGGQQQRMFIARSLAQEAELMLMDEPLTGLDVQSQEHIFTILDELRSRNVTVMVALHDLKRASDHFEQVMLLNHRLVGLGTPEHVLRPDLLVAAYGGRLHLISTEEGVVAVDDTCCD